MRMVMLEEVFYSMCQAMHESTRPLRSMTRGTVHFVFASVEKSM